MPSPVHRAPSEGQPLRFVFAGVAFDVHPAPGLEVEAPTPLRDFAMPYDVAPVSAHVRCAIQGGAAPGAPGRRVDWRWDSASCSISAASCRATVTRSVPGHYAASLSLGDNPWALSDGLQGVAAAAVCREGGLILHATGVLFEGRAVLFLGPSGAGKSTAASLCAGARAFAFDRAAVYSTSDGWYAVGLPGGDPVALESAPARPHPVGALLRVVQRDAVAVRRAGTLDALTLLRESAQAPGTHEDEARCLDAVTRLASEVPCGFVETALGHDLGAALRSISSGS